VSSLGTTDLWPQHWELGLTLGGLAGALFLLSSKGLRQRDNRAAIYGQIAVVLVLAVLAYFIVAMMHWIVKERSAFYESNIRFIMASIAATAFFLQFAVPGFFTIRYLGRLRNAAPNPPAQPLPTEHAFQDGYCHAPLSIGIFGTMALYIAGIGLIAVVLSYVLFEVAWGAVFPLSLLGPILYNRKTTPFEQIRKPIQTVTGGGRVSQFRGSNWPFYRLLVYSDGLEIRAFFHAFFIPYDEITDIDVIRSAIPLATPSLSVECDLPGVPRSIRFISGAAEWLLHLIQKHMPPPPRNAPSKPLFHIT
jgi:hypothetical protein